MDSLHNQSCLDHFNYRSHPNHSHTQWSIGICIAHGAKIIHSYVYRAVSMLVRAGLLHFNRCMSCTNMCICTNSSYVTHYACLKLSIDCMWTSILTQKLCSTKQLLGQIQQTHRGRACVVPHQAERRPKEALSSGLVRSIMVSSVHCRTNVFVCFGPEALSYFDTTSTCQ